MEISVITGALTGVALLATPSNILLSLYLNTVYQGLKRKVIPLENLDMRRIWAQGIWVTAQEAMLPDRQMESK